MVDRFQRITNHHIKMAPLNCNDHGQVLLVPVAFGSFEIHGNHHIEQYTVLKDRTRNLTNFPCTTYTLVGQNTRMIHSSRQV